MEEKAQTRLLYIREFSKFLVTLSALLLIGYPIVSKGTVPESLYLLANTAVAAYWGNMAGGIGKGEKNRIKASPSQGDVNIDK